jgi:hypothetical protein
MDHEKCKVCVEAKLPRHPFKSVDRDSDKLELIHSDICDAGKTSRGGSKYFITFIDDYSRYCYIYLLKGKFECPSKFKVF